jgi:phage-related protein
MLYSQNGSKSDWSGISRQFSALLSPVFEEYSKESKTIGQTLATWTQKSSSEYLKNSKESFSSISGFLKAWGEDFVADNSEGRSEIIGIISSVGESLFGDDIAAFTTWLDGFLDEQKATIAANKATLSKSAGTEDSDDGSGEEENPFSSLLDVVKPLVSSLGIFGDMISGMNPLVAVLKPILEGFVSIMAPALKTVITQVMDALKWIGEALARTLLPILDAIFPSISMIADILIMAISPVLKMLSPVVQLVAAAFSILQPFIILVAKAFTVLASPVQFMGDLFTWLGSWLKYMGDCVAVCAWNLTHWFNQKSYSASPEAFSSDAFSGLGDRLSAIDKGTSSSYVTDSVSTGTSVSSAGYQGATQVTINIYQEAPIVGDGGMRQFATMIRQTFLELDYYGAST